MPGANYLAAYQNSRLNEVVIPGSHDAGVYTGNIFDVDVAAAWHNSTDSVVVLLGWEQQTWDGVPADMMRNLPGTSVVLRERDSVTFSGIKLGVHLIF